MVIGKGCSTHRRKDIKVRTMYIQITKAFSYIYILTVCARRRRHDGGDTMVAKTCRNTNFSSEARFRSSSESVCAASCKD